ncbi:hypothetical protein LEP1GSC186_0043 [Leptospira noguchii serovar Autumnalis str. ZUN142]|uniref:Uncharacterized protein n=1 Tax=Leptospira noguchii serovar Autumnalis str. ZUN142 TaxID=1085540 RepID=M6UDQ6_9LEPT|nr:hypothetical protein LEP1GSC186_0043 [Leptospira noguchii serovar Autumnalis str. ZUN142]
MVPKNNGEFYQRYRSSQKITPNSELLVSHILTFKTNSP